jgi:hypothetical protein
MTNLTSSVGVTTLIVGLLGGNVLAKMAAPLPQVRTSGQVDYLSGGIGDEEAAAIQRMSMQWPLTLEFAIKDGERADFAAGVSVTIHDSNGGAILQAVSEGPLLLARVPPGHYTVDATLGGKTLHGATHVIHGRAVKVVFVWPSENTSTQ